MVKFGAFPFHRRQDCPGQKWPKGTVVDTKSMLRGNDDGDDENSNGHNIKSNIYVHDIDAIRVGGHVGFGWS